MNEMKVFSVSQRRDVGVHDLKIGGKHTTGLIGSDVQLQHSVPVLCLMHLPHMGPLGKLCFVQYLLFFTTGVFEACFRLGQIGACIVGENVSPTTYSFVGTWPGFGSSALNPRIVAMSPAKSAPGGDILRTPRVLLSNSI